MFIGYKMDNIYLLILILDCFYHIIYIFLWKIAKSILSFLEWIASKESSKILSQGNRLDGDLFKNYKNNL